MLSRRNAGVVNLHQSFVALEAALYWIALSFSGLSYTTLLPYFSYPLAVAFGVLLASEGPRKVSPGERYGSVSYLDACRLALRQVTFVCGTIFSVVVLFKDPGISRFFLFVYIFTLFPILILINRYQLKWVAWRFFFARKTVPTLLIGAQDRFPDFDNWLDTNVKLGVRPVGSLSYKGGAVNGGRMRVLGDFSQLEQVIRKHQVRQVVMLDQPESVGDAELLLNACLTNGSRLLIHNNFGSKLGHRLQTIQEERYSFLTLHDEPLEEPLNRGLKRALDVVVSSLVVVCILPPLCVWVWVMQRLQSPGPLFHEQLRRGHDRSRFTILKFRTMHVCNEDLNRQAQKSDPRIFPFGKFLRRTSLDEMPQFINVLRGEMSTVGPRPHLLAHSDAFSRELDVYLLRYFVKPGITGLAQCNGYRGATQKPDILRGRVRLDLEYIRNWSIWLDVWIIAKTAYQVISPPESAV
jgi:exopolysaccharide biosynthesis polyprenyl glycosylphosphotransferase